MSTTHINSDLQAQRAYVKEIEASRFEFGLTVAEAFVRGMRDMGYRSTARALDELIDNAIQAGARNILVAFGFTGKSNKPTSIAIIDDGHGMDPTMVRLSAIWGGTHRENDRNGFGRYGYGLPSACVSQGEKFSVFSVADGGTMHTVSLDLQEIRDGVGSAAGQITMPEAEPADLPAWVADHLEEHLGTRTLTQGTAVVIDKLDRLYRTTEPGLEKHLLQAFSVTYRNFMRDVTVRVNGTKVEPIDPLFTTPGARFYDLDEDRAVALEPASFDVKDSDRKKVLGTVKVRYSVMPPTFARVDKSVERGKNNARLAILEEANGLIIMREGRQIAVVPRGKHLKVNNDDRYWGCEIDIPATLDEEMAITTSKQQVELSDRMWDLLRDAGVFLVIRDMRKQYDDAKAKLRVRREEAKDVATASEQAMQAADKFRTRRPADTPERRERSQRSIDEEVRRRSEASGVDAGTVREQVEQEVQARPYRVDLTESLLGGPFFRIGQVGAQKVLYLNTAHRFFTLVYAGPDSSRRLQAALEVLLFVIGTNQLEAEDDRRTFYDTEIGQWSTELHAVLDQLERIDSSRDAELSRNDRAEQSDIDNA